MGALLAHAGQPPAPHDLWAAWNLDPVVIAVLVATALVHRRGRRRGGRRTDVGRSRCFHGALLAVAVALVSPLEALSSALASAHMVQHVLLILVAAPLFALSAPGSTLLRGLPPVARRMPRRVRRATGSPGTRLLRSSTHPAVAWLLHVGTLWAWHSATAYDAALRSEAVHVTEHATFTLTAVLVWRAIAGARARDRVPEGLGVLLVFGLAMQSVFLSVLMTFATHPWYEGYADTTAAWGLTHLADQQLAGALMWVPAGAVYVLAGLWLLSAWVRRAEAAAGA